MLHPCLDCGLPSEGSRCPGHERAHRALRGRAWRTMAKAAIAAHVAEHGYVCPGWQREPHPSTDLTADHGIPLAVGGDPLPAQVTILCRGCNGRKGTTLRRRGPPLGRGGEGVSPGAVPAAAERHGLAHKMAKSSFLIG